MIDKDIRGCHIRQPLIHLNHIIHANRISKIPITAKIALKTHAITATTAYNIHNTFLIIGISSFMYSHNMLCKFCEKSTMRLKEMIYMEYHSSMSGEVFT